jgi:ATP-binding cassette subfamily B protein
MGLAATWACVSRSAASRNISPASPQPGAERLRSRVFAHVQSLSVGYFDRTKAGRIISRADRDVDTLEPMLIQGPPQFLSAVLRLLILRPYCSG